MLSKIQQVFASAYKDIQRLIWNIQGENSEKMLLRAKQKLQAQFAYWLATNQLSIMQWNWNWAKALYFHNYDGRCRRAWVGQKRGKLVMKEKQGIREFI